MLFGFCSSGISWVKATTNTPSSIFASSTFTFSAREKRLVKALLAIFL
jgi:hypothetical protein